MLELSGLAGRAYAPDRGHPETEDLSLGAVARTFGARGHAGGLFTSVVLF